MMALPPPILAAAAAPRPVRAVVERADGRVHLILIGEADRVTAVRYVLTAIAGGNQATQSGSARLVPHIAQTLLDITQSAAAGWSATLDVEVEGGERYRIPLGDRTAR